MGPSRGEWEAQKDQIERLYLKEGRNLAYIMEKLSDKGFHATCVSNNIFFPSCLCLIPSQESPT